MFTMRFAAKQMSRTSKKCEKEETAERAKVKKAIEKGNPEMARIHATVAIRKKNEALNCLRMSARLDAVASQLRSASMAGSMSNTMSAVVKGLEKAVATENIEQISTVMDQFERQCGQLDTQNSYMDEAMGASGALTTPGHEVDELIQQVADAHGLAVNLSLRGDSLSVSTSLPQSNLASQSPVLNSQDDELTQRLNALRGQ